MIGLIINFIMVLQTAGWDYSAIKLRIEPFTLLLPLLLFGWQMISELQAERLSNETHELTERLMTIPSEVRQGTRDEVNRLKDDNEEFRRQLARGVVEHDQHYYRTLTYKREEGTLFNGFGDEKDLSRNVLFSNKTVNLIFREIRDLDQTNPRLLHQIGKKASERFAAEMVKDIQRQTRTASKPEIERLPEWLRKWIEFDSDAGFGKFELEGNNEQWKEKKIIVLKYSFLTQDCFENRKQSSGLCYFMTGYLEGILNSFPRDVLSPYELYPGDIFVEHDAGNPDECICAGRADFQGCRFELLGKARRTNSPTPSKAVG